MKNLLELIKKYKGVLSYLFFGVCTTIINVAVYNVFYYKISVSNVISTIVAWIVAVLFAFVTNKLFVFESKSFALKIIGYELLSFLGCRLLTGAMDLLIMFVAVDCLHQNAMFWKIISNILVIVINYIASKLVIFKKK